MPWCAQGEPFREFFGAMTMFLLPRRIGAALLILWAIPASARTLEVGPGKTYAQPSLAAAAAKAGDRVVIAAGEYFDCAVWSQNDVVIEGESGGGGAVITDKTC